jgi:hypothetical protein
MLPLSLCSPFLINALVFSEVDLEIEYQYLQFLNDAIMNKTKVLLPLSRIWLSSLGQFGFFFAMTFISFGFYISRV